AEAVPWKSE
nr:Chain F, AEAVPWKSE peptide [synthetic construct]